MARRHAHRLAPGVVGLSLILVFAAIVSVIVPSPALASSSTQSSGLSAAGTDAGPDVIPGTYVTFQCTHGTISLDGTQYCSHTTTAPINLCDSSSCPFNLVGTVDSGYTFYGWLVSGQASVACGSCLSTTLTIYTPNPNNRYSASVILDTAPVTITTTMFENWSTMWTPASQVQACRGSSCQAASNGGTLTLGQGLAYSVTALGLKAHVYFSQWTTNAGSLSNATINPTSFTPQQSGVLSLITKPYQASWAGYIYSPATSSGTVTSVSAWFIVPTHVQGPGFGMWVGIGGVSTTGLNVLSLWQAGIAYNDSSTVPYAFWEACPGGSSGYCSGTLGYGYNHGFRPGTGDTLIVTVTSSGGVSTSSIRDWTQHGHPYWNASYSNSSFVPYSQSGEWALEPTGSSLTAANVPVWNITINGVFPTVYASYMDLWASSVHWIGTLMTAGNPNFTIYHY